MEPILKPRKRWQNSFDVAARPERVFPLLCPVLEYDWIEDWRCEMLYSASGVAEEGCHFRTAFEGDGRMTWIVTRYDPAHCIEFACFVPESHTMRLLIALEPLGDATRLHWTREFTATDAAGEAWVSARTDADQAALMASLAARLRHYLDTGTMLRSTPAPSQAANG